MKLNLILVAVCCLTASIAAPAFAQNSGADTFKAKCAMCHGADGLGATPMGKAMKAASFKNPALVNAPDSQLINSIKNGKNKMPAYGGKLTDNQIKAVVVHIRSLQK
jgi:mono/diheme cytochrome c family protein